MALIHAHKSTLSLSHTHTPPLAFFSDFPSSLQSSGIILEINVKLIKLIKPPHVLWGSISACLWGRATPKPTHLAANHFPFYSEFSFYSPQPENTRCHLSSAPLSVCVCVCFIIALTANAALLSAGCWAVNSDLDNWQKEARRQKQKRARKVQRLDVGNHQKQSPSSDGPSFTIYCVVEETEWRVCDCTALSVFLLSDNEGEEKFKAQAFVCVRVGRRPAAGLEKEGYSHLHRLMKVEFGPNVPVHKVTSPPLTMHTHS